jgi:hypothetical protein
MLKYPENNKEKADISPIDVKKIIIMSNNDS